MLTVARLREVLDYDPDTGVFRWRVSLNARGPVGAVAGSLRGDRPYRVIRIDGGRHYAHRLAWLYVTGAWPKTELDHVNCDCSDNRFGNLRLATRAQNNANMRKRPGGTSGFKGVSWNTREEVWIAQISISNQTRYLGRYKTEQDAHAAYVKAATERSGEFARV